MNHDFFWLEMEETKELKQKIKSHLEEKQRVIHEGSLLNYETSERIASNYSYNIGLIDSLRHTLEIIKSIGEKEDEQNSNNE
ncbi:MAG: hypothetical protein ACFFD1_00155 [Candidatus Thorarchaeota archaeon]